MKKEKLPRKNEANCFPIKGMNTVKKILRSWHA